MKSTRKLVVGIATVASLGIAAVAFAVDGPGPGFGPGMGPGMAAMGAAHGPQNMRGAGMGAPNFDMAAMADARLTRIKAALKITTDQEGPWSALAATVKQQAAAMQAIRTAAIQEAKTTVPERMTQHILIAQHHVDNMKALQPKVTALYDVLSADQKAVADKMLGRMHGRMGPPAN